MELTDHNGNTFRSCATSFGDEVAMTVKTAQGQLHSRDGFETHGDPFNFVLDAPASPDAAQGATELLWSRSAGRGGSGQGGHRFFVHSSYLPESFRICWGASFPAGLYVQSASFNLAIPANLEPEIKLVGKWLPLADGWSCEQWPQAVRWHRAGSSVEVALAHPSSVSAAGACARAVPTNIGSPGGENSFCPYPVLQLRLGVALSSESDRIAADMSVTPLAAG